MAVFEMGAARIQKFIKSTSVAMRLTFLNLRA